MERLLILLSILAASLILIQFTQKLMDKKYSINRGAPPPKSCIKKYTRIVPKYVRFNPMVTVIPPDPRLTKYDRYNPQLKPNLAKNYELARKAGSGRALAYYSLNLE